MSREVFDATKWTRKTRTIQTHNNGGQEVARQCYNNHTTHTLDRLQSFQFPVHTGHVWSLLSISPQTRQHQLEHFHWQPKQYTSYWRHDRPQPHTVTAPLHERHSHSCGSCCLGHSATPTIVRHAASTMASVASKLRTSNNQTCTHPSCQIRFGCRPCSRIRCTPSWIHTHNRHHPYKSNP
jgi:hypothetical protein